MGWDPFGTIQSGLIKSASRAQAAAAKQAAQAEAQSFRFNADVLRDNADRVERAALVDEGRQRLKNALVRGEQNAAIASSGFSDVGFGDIRRQTDEQLDLDAVLIRRQGQFAAADYLDQATLAELNADTAIKTGNVNARMAILEGNARAASAETNAISQTVGLGLQAASIYFSDERIKRDLRHVGALPNGIPVYEFNYLWDADDAARRVGVIVADVVKVRPEAVSRSPEGFYLVDYGKL